MTREEIIKIFNEAYTNYQVDSDFTKDSLEDEEDLRNVGICYTSATAQEIFASLLEDNYEVAKNTIEKAKKLGIDINDDHTELDIQISVNFEDLEVYRYFDHNIINTIKYGSPEELIESELNCNWNDQYSDYMSHFDNWFEKLNIEDEEEKEEMKVYELGYSYMDPDTNEEFESNCLNTVFRKVDSIKSFLDNTDGRYILTPLSEDEDEESDRIFIGTSEEELFEEFDKLKLGKVLGKYKGDLLRVGDDNWKSKYLDMLISRPVDYYHDYYGLEEYGVEHLCYYTVDVL